MYHAEYDLTDTRKETTKKKPCTCQNSTHLKSASNGYCSSCIVFSGPFFIVCAYGDSGHIASTRSENDNRAAAGIGSVKGLGGLGTVHCDAVGCMFGSPCE